MAISLSKGGNISLSKEDPSLNNLVVGLGWDARSTDGQAFDLDASGFMLASNDKVRSDFDFIFYNQAKSQCGSITHTGDNKTGAGNGPDESLEITLNKVPAEVTKIAFAVTIHDADARKQNFGMVTNGFIQCVNKDSGKEIARYDLSEDASVETAMIFGEIYRDASGGWKFRAIGQGFKGGLAPLATNFGVKV
jgi:tellurium resistance protein TerD